MKVYDVISEFDIKGKVFEMIDVSDTLGRCSDSEKMTIEYQAELIAVNLVENYEDKDDILGEKLYFGPYIVYQDSTTGNIIEYPDRKQISTEIIEYWEKRAIDAKNDILKARYCGLVWEFKPYVTNCKCDINIAKMYIQSLICIINNDYVSHTISAVKKAERAISLSLKLQQYELLNDAKNALSALIKRHDDWNSIGIWGSAYRISREYRNSYTSDEQKCLISELEERFNRIYEFIKIKGEEKRDPWLLMDLADILAGYYQQHSPVKIKALFDKVEQSFDLTRDKFTNMQLTEVYRRMSNTMIKYGLNDQASEICRKMTECGKNIKKEFAQIEHEFSISNKDIDSVVDAILQDNNTENSCIRIACHFIPKKDREKCTLERIAKETPFMHMIPHYAYGENGRLTTIVRGIDTDLEGQLVLHISMSLRLESVFLNATIDKAKQKGILTVNNILKYISKTPVIKKDRIPIIKRGLDAYFCEDYVVAIHLLIPQIEEAIRTILDLNGIRIIKPNKSGTGFQLRTLDEMLRDSDAVKKLTDDIANYFRILLTDNRGWNLRNEVCHGIAEFKTFNKLIADRVIHALFCLGLFQLKIKE